MKGRKSWFCTFIVEDPYPKNCHYQLYITDFFQCCPLCLLIAVSDESVDGLAGFSPLTHVVFLALWNQGVEYIRMCCCLITQWTKARGQIGGRIRAHPLNSESCRRRRGMGRHQSICNVFWAEVGAWSSCTKCQIICHIKWYPSILLVWVSNVSLCILVQIRTGVHCRVHSIAVVCRTPFSYAWDSEEHLQLVLVFCLLLFQVVLKPLQVLLNSQGQSHHWGLKGRWSISSVGMGLFTHLSTDGASVVSLKNL